MPSAEFPRRQALRAGDGPELSLLRWSDEGPLCVLHHANGFCAGTWGRVAEALQADFQVVALDARGHGCSAGGDLHGGYAWPLFASDLLSVLEELLATTDHTAVPLLVGHSFGGTAALHVAIDRPSLIERMLLLDPVILPSEVLAMEG